MAEPTTKPKTTTKPKAPAKGELPAHIEAALTAIEASSGKAFSEEERKTVALLVERYPELSDPTTTPAELAGVVEKVKKGETIRDATDLLGGRVKKPDQSLWARFQGEVKEFDQASWDILKEPFSDVNPETARAQARAARDPANVLARLVTPGADNRYQNLLTVSERTGAVGGATSGVPGSAGAPGTNPFQVGADEDEMIAYREAVKPKTKTEADAELSRIIRTGGTDVDVFQLEPQTVEDPVTGKKMPLTYIDEFGVKQSRLDPDDPNLVLWDDLSPAARKRREAEHLAKAEKNRPRQPTGKGPTQSDYDRLKDAEIRIAETAVNFFSPEYEKAQADLTTARKRVKDATTAQTSFGSRQAFESNEEYLRQAKMPAAWSNVDSMSLNQLLDKPWLMSPDELTRLQVKLFEGGAYADAGLNYDPKRALSQQVRLGDANDPLFKKVWRNFGNEAMADRTKTWMAHLETRRATYKPILDYERDLAAKQDAESKIRKFSLTDPAAIREAGRQLGPEIGGRRLTPEEEAATIEFIHARETAMGTAQTDPLVSGAIVDVDVDAELAEAIRGHMGVEADANDMAQQYMTFTDLLRGPGR